MFKQLGDVIKDAMFSKNMTQKQVAKELNIAPQTFNAYINNRRTPSLLTFYQIIQYLDIDANKALGVYTATHTTTFDSLLYSAIQQLSDEQQQIILDFFLYLQTSDYNLQKYQVSIHEDNY